MKIACENVIVFKMAIAKIISAIKSPKSMYAKLHRTEENYSTSINNIWIVKAPYHSTI